MTRIIDMHSHAFSKKAEELVHGIYDPASNPYRRDMSQESRDTDAGNRIRTAAMLNNVEQRLADMARMRIDMQVVAPAPAQQHYWAEPDLLASLSATQNDHIAAMVAEAPTRFAGMGTLPLSAPDKAVTEATRCVEELGLRGFQIDSRVGSRELSDAAFDPVWARVAKLNVPLFIHPLGFSDGARLGPFFMVNTVGQPLEEVIAINHLIFGGILDRHPDLKVVVAHGGGYFPSYLGRVDHAWKVRPEVHRLCADAPSTYMRRMFFDTCVFNTTEVEALVAQAGAERVMLGSDYPFDMGDTNPVALVESCMTLDEDQRNLILGNAAAALFGL
jgi:aminocarboxymuconate-semialdehyde decarboxylase